MAKLDYVEELFLRDYERRIARSLMRRIGDALLFFLRGYHD